MDLTADEVREILFHLCKDEELGSLTVWVNLHEQDLGIALGGLSRDSTEEAVVHAIRAAAQSTPGTRIQQQLADGLMKLNALMELQLKLQAENSMQSVEQESDTSSQVLEACMVTSLDVSIIDVAQHVNRERLRPLNCVEDKVHHEWLSADVTDASQQEAVRWFLHQQLLSSDSLRQRFAVVAVDTSDPNQLPTTASFSHVRPAFLAQAHFLVVPASKAHLHAVFLRKYAVIAIYTTQPAIEDTHYQQARLGHLVYGSRSNHPLLYVLTDLKDGGVVHWAVESHGSKCKWQVMEQSISGMKALITFLTTALSAVSDRAVADYASPQDLQHSTQPDRDKLFLQLPPAPQWARERPLKDVRCWDHHDNEEHDLQGFDEELG